MITLHGYLRTRLLRISHARTRITVCWLDCTGATLRYTHRFVRLRILQLFLRLRCGYAPRLHHTLYPLPHPTQLPHHYARLLVPAVTHTTLHTFVTVPRHLHRLVAVYYVYLIRVCYVTFGTHTVTFGYTVWFTPDHRTRTRTDFYGSTHVGLVYHTPVARCTGLHSSHIGRLFTGYADYAATFTRLHTPLRFTHFTVHGYARLVARAILGQFTFAAFAYGCIYGYYPQFTGYVLILRGLRTTRRSGLVWLHCRFHVLRMPHHHTAPIRTLRSPHTGRTLQLDTVVTRTPYAFTTTTAHTVWIHYTHTVGTRLVTPFSRTQFAGCTRALRFTTLPVDLRYRTRLVPRGFCGSGYAHVPLFGYTHTAAHVCGCAHARITFGSRIARAFTRFAHMRVAVAFGYTAVGSVWFVLLRITFIGSRGCYFLIWLDSFPLRGYFDSRTLRLPDTPARARGWFTTVDLDTHYLRYAHPVGFTRCHYSRVAFTVYFAHTLLRVTGHVAVYGWLGSRCYITFCALRLVYVDLRFAHVHAPFGYVVTCVADVYVYVGIAFASYVCTRCVCTLPTRLLRVCLVWTFTRY